MTPTEAFDRAVELAGSETELGRRIGVSQNAIWQARQRDKASPEMAMAIEQALAGEVTARELRPDLPWPEYAPAPATHEQRAAT